MGLLQFLGPVPMIIRFGVHFETHIHNKQTINLKSEIWIWNPELSVYTELPNGRLYPKRCGPELLGYHMREVIYKSHITQTKWVLIKCI